MLIFFIVGNCTAMAICTREFIRIIKLPPNFLDHLRSQKRVWQIAPAIGLKVKKWLTNSQFELREESYFFKKIYRAV